MILLGGNYDIGGSVQKKPGSVAMDLGLGINPPYYNLTKSWSGHRSSKPKSEQILT